MEPQVGVAGLNLDHLGIPVMPIITHYYENGGLRLKINAPREAHETFDPQLFLEITTFEDIQNYINKHRRSFDAYGLRK